MAVAAKSMQFIKTDVLTIAYQRSGPADGKKVILLHGWPDDPSTWDRIIPALHEAGWETIVPYLRGFGPTIFNDENTFRSGQLSALGQDVIDFADALELQQFAVIGHDWGARAAYIASNLIPERISHCIALSVGWGTNDPNQSMPLHQVQNYWYQWYMSTNKGEALVNQDWKTFVRYIWKIWNPEWEYNEDEFCEAEVSFENPDWREIVLHSYQVRWGFAETDPNYQALEERLQQDTTIHVPTLVIHGGADPCNAPSTSEGKDDFFSDTYQRVVLDHIGHFPQREAAEEVQQTIMDFLK